ncbi:MAG TPA: magnesium/cobalt transporter CorA [Ignavibacteria bacterium]|nr:magnesium and cobalt transport protein CorA [Bacteroidota bacterium]HRI84931.1 magnesium/cobalt transporter CorA [Ignavibacteria bacterium]HRK00124.1 magnesium/cobalt transporter CorA [Ignavibacteria bacterium]
MITTTVYNSEKGLFSISGDTLTKWDYENQDIVWTDIHDVTSEETSRLLKDTFQFHPLAIEDSYKYIRDHAVHHPKIDDFEKYLFIVFNGIQADESGKKYSIFSLSCFLGKNFLVTIHNEKGENTISKNIKNYISESAFKKGPDFILNLILDEIVDRYYPVLDHIEAEIDTVESRIFKEMPSNRNLLSILNLKKELIKLRRISSYQKEILYKLSRRETDLISLEESVYYRNVYDHLVRVADTAESYRDYVSGILDSYLSVVNNKMNEVMKFLTIIATIMLPLTLITGIFGMNFHTIPFLQSEFGFYISIILMIIVATVMLGWFRYKKWL